MTTLILRRLAVVLASVALLVAGCGDDDADGASDGLADSTTTDASETSPEDSTTTTETTTTEAEGTVVDVTVQNGEVSGGGRQQVPLGEEVTLRVTSDVTDEAHVHGYDLHADVPAGETAEVTFEADIPGVFEVELHDSGIQVAELEIS